MFAPSNTLRRVVFVVGQDANEVRQVRLRLGMYSAVAVTETSLEGLADEIRVSAPDCVVGLLVNRRWGDRFLKTLAPRQPVGIVLAMQKPKPPLIAFARNIKAPFTYGRRGLAIRAAALVAENLMLAPHTVPRLLVDEAGLRHCDGSLEPVTLADACAHSALLQVAESVKQRTEQRAQLTLSARDEAPLVLDGAFESWELLAKNGEVKGLFCFHAVGAGDRARWDGLLWRWTEAKLAAARKNGESTTAVRTSHRTTPTVKFTVKINPVGTKQQYYFRIDNIGRSGAMLAADADFATGLTPGDRVGLRIGSVRGQVSLVARVVRVQPAGANPGAPERQMIAVDFLQETSSAVELGRLLCLAEVE